MFKLLYKILLTLNYYRQFNEENLRTEILFPRKTDQVLRTSKITPNKATNAIDMTRMFKISVVKMFGEC